MTAGKTNDIRKEKRVVHENLSGTMIVMVSYIGTHQSTTTEILLSKVLEIIRIFSR
jgi:hypothetical protein